MLSPSPVAERARPIIRTRLDTEVRRARPLLGTIVDIRVAGPFAEKTLHSAIDAAFAAVERVQSLMSYHDPASELSRLNRKAASREQQIDDETYAVLEAALRFAALSNGAFDPCIGERLEKWGYLPQSAPSGDMSGTSSGSWRDVYLTDRSRVRFGRPVRLDLGGIAKGYAVDRAIQALQRAGVEKILVNAGGDMRISGNWEQRIGLRAAHSPHLSAATLTLANAALATSASYYSRRRLPDGEVSALLDPRSTIPYTDNGSVTVRAADCMSADALTKVVLFAAPGITEQVLTAYGAHALLQSAAESSG